MIFIVFDKKCSSSGVATLVNKFAVHGNFNKKERPFVDIAMLQLAEELHWPIIKKIEKGNYIFHLKTKYRVWI